MLTYVLVQMDLRSFFFYKHALYLLIQWRLMTEPIISYGNLFLMHTYLNIKN